MIAAMASAPSLWADTPTPRLRNLTYDSQKKEWIEKTPPLPGTPEGDLFIIRRLNSEERYRAASQAITDFEKSHGKSDALYAEVILAKAEALIGREKFDDAHELLQKFLDEYGGMTITVDALRLEFIIAEAYLGGVKRTVWGIFRVSAVEEGHKILDEIIADYPDTKLAELALKAKADRHFRAGEHDLAELEYARLLREYAQSRYQEYALRRAADSALASFAGVDYDEAALIEAQERYNDFRVRFGSAGDREQVTVILDSIRQSRAEKEYRIGEYYERTDHLSSAVFYYQLVMKEWPNSIAATKAASRLDLLGASAPVAVTAPSAGRP
jgi:outer membrane protein assembly factor BamD (BamD/ComL family)